MASNADLTWDSVSDAIEYKVEYKKDSSPTWLTAPGSPVTTNALSFVVEEGTTYDFRVFAICAASDSSPSIFVGTSVCKPATSLTATPGPDEVELTWNGAPEHESYNVYYKLDSDPTYTLAAADLPNAYPATNNYTVTGLTPGETYDFAVRTNCVDANSVNATITTSIGETIWLRGSYICEQDNVFDLSLTVSNLSSPQGLYWDNVSSRFYVVDLDDPSGNLWRFNPATFNNASQRDYVPGTIVSGNEIQAHAFDEGLRRVFMAGSFTGGLVVYDIPSGTVTTVPYGANIAFSRLLVTIFGNLVYCTNDKTSGPIVPNITIINKTTLAVTNTINISSIPSGSTYLSKSYKLFMVGSEIWACAGYSRTNGDIGRYTSDFSSLIGTISIPSATVPGWGASDTWQAQFYDEEKNRFYIGDVGSKKIFVLDTVTRTIIKTIDVVNRSEKDWATMSFSLNKLTGELYTTISCFDDPVDTPIVRYYRIDRDTQDYELMILNQAVSDLRNREGTAEFWATNQGTVEWSGSPTWNTDGFVYKYTS